MNPAKWLLALAALLVSCGSDSPEPRERQPAPERVETAVFAGGCFWCTEADFEHVNGVVEAVSGYTGGHVANPSYRQVTAGGTGHYEAVRVTWDPARVSYGELVRFFFRSVDPTDRGGQFCDRGESYRTAIFVADAEQRRLAEAAKAEADEALGGDRVVTPILPLAPFYEAEEYHQDYARLNPIRYRYYRWRCGRDARLRDLWGE
ncbi:MAG: peptide-methionine (S)-S-oxide reductase MsrA [Pseudomonadota bacterium]|nr:peptide-methionine (S)-S-oxide reductase MsrA [Pseudomonadota bacterium]